MRRKGRPKKQKAGKGGKRGRSKRIKEDVVVVTNIEELQEGPPPKKGPGRPKRQESSAENMMGNQSTDPDDNYSEGLHMSTMQVRALGDLVACKECGEGVILGVRPTTKGMISEFTVFCKTCGSSKSTNTPNLIRERKRKREKKGAILQKNENINYAHVAAFLDNGLGYSGLRHYCKYLNARCLNEATFIVYARQVIADAVADTEEFLHQNARIVRKAFETQLDSEYVIDLTVGYTTTYHQWGSDFCLVAGAVIELQTGLVVDFDVANMYCHVCKINAKKIVSMSPVEMTEWFNKHQDTCEIREWCDEIDQDSEEGIKEIDPKYLEAFIAKKIWGRSMEKFGFRYTTLIHESDEKIHSELLKSTPYGDIPILIDNITNCFSRRKSEHARTSFQSKLKSKCPRERVQTKDRIMYVYATSIPEYNKFAIGSNIKLRALVRQMEIEEEEFAADITLQAAEILPAIEEHEMKGVRRKVVEQVEEEGVEYEEEMMEEEEDEEEEEEEIDIDEGEEPAKVVVKKEPKDSKQLSEESASSSSKKSAQNESEASRKDAVPSSTKSTKTVVKDSVRNSLDKAPGSPGVNSTSAKDADKEKTKIDDQKSKTRSKGGSTTSKEVSSSVDEAKQNSTLASGKVPAENGVESAGKGTKSDRQEVKPFRVELEED